MADSHRTLRWTGWRAAVVSAAIGAAAASSVASGADRVTLQLRWDHQFQFAGYYAADWNGYYRDAGIEVEIRSALHDDGIHRSTEQVQAGRAEFGIGAADILTANHAGADLVVVSSIFQESSAALVALAESDLNSPADLLRLRRAASPKGLIDVEVRAMLLLEGLDPQAGPTVPYAGGLSDLLEGQADVLPGYTISFPWVFEQAGLEYRVLKPSSYGVKFYGDSLFTRRELAERDPDLVVRFRDASLRGWRYALEHPEEIAQRIAYELPRSPNDQLEYPLAFNLFQSEQVKKLTIFPVIEVGHVNHDRWERMHALLIQTGLIAGECDIEALIFDPQRWEARRWARTASILFTVLGLLVVASLVCLLWITMLRRTVAARTKGLKQAMAEKVLLMQELDHRAKNILAAVHGLLSQTARACEDVPTLAKKLGDRICAMARTHEMLARRHWSHLDLDETIAQVLSAFGADDDRIAWHGLPVTLPARFAQPFGLVLHELGTNAVKHGALSRTDGSLEIHWQVDSDQVLEMVWQERWPSGPRLSSDGPNRINGTGQRLIRGLVEYEMRGRVETSVNADGFGCRLELPLRKEDWLEPQPQVRHRKSA